MGNVGLGISLLNSMEMQSIVKRPSHRQASENLADPAASYGGSATSDSEVGGDMLAPKPQEMTGDQLRGVLASKGLMSLHAYSITQTFQPNSSGGFTANSSGSEDWITKMQGILSFDQQHDNADFVQQDTNILDTLESLSKKL